MHKAYKPIGVVLGAAGLLYIWFGPVSGVQHSTVTGITVFAVLYVIAQAVERVVEWVTEFLRLSKSSPGSVKASAVLELRRANATARNTASSSSASAAETKAYEETVAENKSRVAFVAHGLAILLAGLAVNALNYGILGSIGAQGVPGDVDRMLTALAAAGGSKTLHELIGRVQANKEATQTGAAA